MGPCRRRQSIIFGRQGIIFKRQNYVSWFAHALVVWVAVMHPLHCKGLVLEDAAHVFTGTIARNMKFWCPLGSHVCDSGKETALHRFRMQRGRFAISGARCSCLEFWLKA